MPRARIAILHQGCVPTYRKAFFERLARYSAHEYVVFHGEPAPDSGIHAATPPFAFPNRQVHNRHFSILGRAIVYQPVLREILGGRFDALIIGHEAKFVASMILFGVFRALGRPVLLWGFGQSLDPSRQWRGTAGRMLGRLLGRSKTLMIRAASGFLAYTEEGAEFVRRAGLAPERVTVVFNTIDMAKEIEAHRETSALDEAELRRQLGFRADSVILTFIGRLTREKEVNLLLDAARTLSGRPGLPPIELAIVGDGPERSALEARAIGLAGCRFLGYIGDAQKLAPIFRVSAAIVLPGYVGLTVNHAIAHGRPVITRDIAAHSPEIEYLAHGENGLLLPHDSEGFADGLAEFVSSPRRQAALAHGALAGRDVLDLGRMVSGFDGGVTAALAGRVTPRTA